MRDFNHCLFRSGKDLIIFAETSGMAQPCQSALNNPAPRELFPLMRLNFLRNINIKLKLFLQIRYKSTQISSISAEFLNRWVPFVCWPGGRDACLCIMDIGGMNHDSQ